MRQVIDKYAAMPFEYGRDCCTFVGECIESLTGYDPSKEFSYKTASEAEAIIQRHGSLAGAISSVLGDPYDGRKDGDVCLIDANDGTQAAAMIYRGRVVARVPGGLMDYPIDRAIMAWAL